MKHHFIPVPDNKGGTYGKCQYCGKPNDINTMGFDCPGPAPVTHTITKDQMPPQGHAVKYDEDKLPLHLIDPLWLESTAQVLQFGARKYSAWNWAKGTFAYSRLYGALQRHLQAWWAGEDNDPETQLPHLWHANCCMMFLTRYAHDALGSDDRPYTQSQALRRRGWPAPLPRNDLGGGPGRSRGTIGDPLLRCEWPGIGPVPGGSGLEPGGDLQDECVQDSPPEQQARVDLSTTDRVEELVRCSFCGILTRRGCSKSRCPIPDRQQNPSPPPYFPGGIKFP